LLSGELREIEESYTGLSKGGPAFFQNPPKHCKHDSLKGTKTKGKTKKNCSVGKTRGTGGKITGIYRTPSKVGSGNLRGRWEGSNGRFLEAGMGLQKKSAKKSQPGVL